MGQLENYEKILTRSCLFRQKNKEEIKKMQERVADEREKAKKLFGKRGIHRFHSEGKGLSRGGRS